MKNTQVAWIIAAIIIVGLALAVVISKGQVVEAGPVEGVTTPPFSHSDVMADRALECITSGGVWNAYAGHCEMYGTTP